MLDIESIRERMRQYQYSARLDISELIDEIEDLKKFKLSWPYMSDSVKIICNQCGPQEMKVETSVDRSEDIIFIVRIACSKCEGTIYLWFDELSKIPKFI